MNNMSLTFFDFALTIGLALVFARFGYSQYRASDPKPAVPRAAADGDKGNIGLAVVILGQKFIIPQ